MRKRTICIFVLLVCAVCLLFSGCRYDTYGYGSDYAFAANASQPINPNNEKFTYISSERIVEGDLVTITFTYKLESKEE